MKSTGYRKYTYIMLISIGNLSKTIRILLFELFEYFMECWNCKMRNIYLD